MIKIELLFKLPTKKHVGVFKKTDPLGMLNKFSKAKKVMEEKKEKRVKALENKMLSNIVKHIKK